MGYIDIVVGLSSWLSFRSVDAVVEAIVSTVMSSDDDDGGSTETVVAAPLLDTIDGSTSIEASDGLPLVVVTPEESVDDADTVEREDVLGIAETFDGLAGGKVDTSCSSSGVRDETVRTVGLELYLDVTTLAHGKQLEMTWTWTRPWW